VDGEQVSDTDPFGARLGMPQQRLRTPVGDLGRLVGRSCALINRGDETSTLSVECATARDRVSDGDNELTRRAPIDTLPVEPSRLRIPYNLPPSPSSVVGRDAETERLAEYLCTDRELRHGAGRVCVLHGMGGVGKTTLAVWVAQRAYESYPDGCMYLDLQGCGPDPVTEMEALDQLIRMLGTPGQLIPPELNDRISLYRQSLARRRVLVILDGAEGSRQVRNLRPSGPGCAAIITSRVPLTALDDTYQVALGGLPHQAAIWLFRSIALLDSDHAARDDPIHVESIVQMCCHLPLAVRIVAARFRDNETRTLASLALRLSKRPLRLQEIDDGERSLTAVLASSCAALSAGQRRILGQLAVQPGVRIDPFTTAALADSTPGETERQLDTLTRAGMLEYHSAGAYRLHDFLHDYLRHTTPPLLTDNERRLALNRLYDYYLRTAALADSYIARYRYRVRLTLRQDQRFDVDITDYRSALAWMSGEAENFLPTIREMYRDGSMDVCWQFTYCLRGYFFVTKPWKTWVEAYRIAAAAAARLRDRRAEGMMLNNLGLALTELGRPDDAADCYARAREAFSEVRDPYGEINTVANYSWLHYFRGNFASALRLGREAVKFYRAVDQRPNAAIALDCVARAELALGSLADATRHFEQVLRDFTKLDFPPVDIAQVLSHLGRALTRNREYTTAETHYRRAIMYSRSGGSLHEEASAREGLATVYEALGRHEQATKHRAAARDRYEILGTHQARRLTAEQAGTARQTLPTAADATIQPPDRALSMSRLPPDQPDTARTVAEKTELRTGGHISAYDTNFNLQQHDAGNFLATAVTAVGPEAQAHAQRRMPHPATDPTTPTVAGTDQDRRTSGHSSRRHHDRGSSPVFISYAHDSPEHIELVRRFWWFLRNNGVDATLDLSAAERPREWPLWLHQQLADARHVLVVASPAYKHRAESDHTAEEGRGVHWEARLIRELIYAGAAQPKILPIVLPGRSTTDIPDWLGPRGSTHYTVTNYTITGAESLLRYLTGQPDQDDIPLGTVPVLSPRGH
jgi:tetratricopeptide (TPR) repeat protein